MSEKEQTTIEERLDWDEVYFPFEGGISRIELPKYNGPRSLNLADVKEELILYFVYEGAIKTIPIDSERLSTNPNQTIY